MADWSYERAVELMKEEEIKNQARPRARVYSAFAGCVAVAVVLSMLFVSDGLHVHFELVAYRGLARVTSTTHIVTIDRLSLALLLTSLVLLTTLC